MNTAFLIDNIIAVLPGESVTSITNITLAAEYYIPHNTLITYS